MITVDITSDHNYLIVTPQSEHELKQIELSFTRTIPNAYIIKKTAAYLPTEKTFYNTQYNILSVGHWLQFMKVCRDYVLDYTMTEAVKQYIGGFNLKKEDFIAYIDKTFGGALNLDGEPFYPYDYQIEAAYNLLKYKKSTVEISTSGGKTLISYIIFRFLYEVCGIDHMIYIVPSVDLATQTIDKYHLYDSFLKNKGKNWTGGVLKSRLRKREIALVDNCNILFATYQSLCKKPDAFFDKFKSILVDECHHATNDSIRKILDKTKNLEYCMGMTGTYPKENTYDYLMLTALLGPVVFMFTAYQLINEKKTGTPIYVIMEIMDYATPEEKAKLYYARVNKDDKDITAGMDLLRDEALWINQNEYRMKHIVNMACKTKKNTLVLFGDIKNGYGEDLYEKIKISCDKDVYYCDGNTPTDIRDYYKKKMEDDATGNTIIVASIGVFGEGIDIPNLSAIFLVNTVKSERLVRQILGRGLRKSKGKDMAVLIDFVDDLRYGDGYSRDNYMWKHQRERRKIYAEQRFPVTDHNVTLR